jgi:hypothetical protein
MIHLKMELPAKQPSITNTIDLLAPESCPKYATRAENAVALESLPRARRSCQAGYAGRLFPKHRPEIPGLRVI